MKYRRQTNAVLDDVFGLNGGPALLGRSFREIAGRVHVVRRLTDSIGRSKAAVRILDAALKAATAAGPLELDSAINDLMAEALMARGVLHSMYPELTDALTQKVERRNKEGRS